jgi:hypothetical protein
MMLIRYITQIGKILPHAKRNFQQTDQMVRYEKFLKKLMIW